MVHELVDDETNFVVVMIGECDSLVRKELLNERPQMKSRV
jgi:hypothetical protein